MYENLESCRGGAVPTATDAALRAFALVAISDEHPVDRVGAVRCASRMSLELGHHVCPRREDELNGIAPQLL